MRGLIRLLIVIAIGFAVFGILKNQPDGISVEGTVFSVPSDSVTFFEDTTYVGQNGVRTSEQEIFDEVFRMIKDAREYVLIDMFLFNDFLGNATTSYRALSSELTSNLITKKENSPNIDIVLITDPINNIYGGLPSVQLQNLRDAGVEVVVTDLLQLRDSNPLYSGFYRAYFRWFEPSSKEGKFPNPFDSRLQKLNLRTYLSLFNFKANHRKVIMADSGNKMSVLVTSANPHDGSSAHTNTAVKVDDAIWKEVLESEVAVAVFSGIEISRPSDDFLKTIYDRNGNTKVQLLTEGKIREKIIKEINLLEVGDTVDMAMFYFSDRKVISSLKKADDKGVKIRILLDPNKDAFGREKNGIPNRPVANELLKASRGNTNIRFCDTNGEQCHTKLILIKKNNTNVMIQGSANITRRNIGNFNLETNILVEGENVKAISDARNYFEKVWNNEDGKKYSTGYDSYKDESKMKTFIYRVMEELGTSSF